MKILLTLTVPAALEEDTVGFLLVHPEWAAGFTTLTAFGHGASKHSRSTAEEVSGRVMKTQFQIVTDEASARALVAKLKTQSRTPGLAWWMSPVNDFGRFE
jgi:hypothetical protein